MSDILGSEMGSPAKFLLTNLDPVIVTPANSWTDHWLKFVL